MKSFYLHALIAGLNVYAFSVIQNQFMAEMMHGISILIGFVFFGLFLVLLKYEGYTLHRSLFFLPMTMWTLPRLYFCTGNCPYTLIVESYKHNHPESRLEIYVVILISIFVSWCISVEIWKYFGMKNS